MNFCYTFDYMNKRYKIVVFVPVTNADTLREAMGNAGAGVIGNYSHCTFTSTGIGRFRPVEGAHPTIGEVGKFESVEEEKKYKDRGKEMIKRIVDEPGPLKKLAVKIS